MVTFERECPSCNERHDFPLSNTEKFNPPFEGKKFSDDNQDSPEPTKIQFWAGFGFCPNCECPAFVTFAMGCFRGNFGSPEDPFEKRGELAKIALAGSLLYLPDHGKPSFKAFTGYFEKKGGYQFETALEV